jgi:phthiocerol/phenolphthiocerol synthesis type-I polyketide synthase E
MSHDVHETDPSLDIAIIGMASRFPGAPDLATFWANLRLGREGIGFFDEQVLRARGVPEAQLTQDGFVKASPVIDDIDGFDAAFFGYSPAEARLIDPQQRVFLECTWHALEDAGYGTRGGDRAVGVFAGTSLSTYLLFNLLTRADIRDAQDSFQVMIGNDKDFLCTRVSYHMDLRGPSIDVQTGCSTSLVATHLACQALLTYQCDMALAGGVSIAVPQRTGYIHQPGGIASPDGHCRAFDRQGQGTIFGSGVGVCVLKRLDDALADRDHIYAVIKASAINNDGANKVGYTAPSVSGQVDAIVRAHTIAGIDPATIHFVEGHGTGTPLGDPVEVAALNQAFASSRGTSHRCALGSVKSNIGHLDAAAGVAGLIKTVLAVAHGEIPPTLHFEQPNPNISWDEGPFYVNRTLEPWPAHEGPRRAGVSSFGIGGTNAHMVVEQAPARVAAVRSEPWQILPLSARSRGILDQLSAQLALHLEAHPELELADVAYTLQVGREPLPERQVVICRDREDAIQCLRGHDAERTPIGSSPTERRGVAFLFPGGGAQYRNMGRELYETEPVFREHMDRCATILKSRRGLALHRALYESRDAGGDARAGFTEPAIALPALFAVEFSLARLWIALGIKPVAMLGHSMGEYVAACLAGVFSLEGALELVSERARLFETLPPGGMLSVAEPEETLAPLLGTDVAIAAINAPDQSAVAGHAAAIAALAAELERRQIEHRRIPIDVAAHSPVVDPILPTFAAFVARLPLRPPAIPFVSSVTGRWITDAEATNPEYWARHLRQTVRFAEGAATLLAHADNVLVEVGPGRTLSSLAKRQAGGRRSAIVQCMPAAQEPQRDRAALLGALGRLWLCGVDIDWTRLERGAPRGRIPLPGYPFEHRRYWLDPHTLESRGTGIQPDRRSDLDDWLYVPSWRRAPLSGELLPRAGRDVLVFADVQGVGQALARDLTRAGHRVTMVHLGASFGRVDHGLYTLAADDRVGHEALWRELGQDGRRPAIIVHLWNVGDAASDRELARDLACARRLAFDSLLFLGQCLGADTASGPVRLCVVSTGVHAVTGAEDLCPPKALLLGPCKVLPLELAHVTCHNIDIAPPGSLAECERAAALVLHELDTPGSSTIVAHRGPYRWEQTVESMRVGTTNATDAIVRSGGVYLITGGLGDIGLVLAEHLAASVPGVRLALLGRSALPLRSEWPAWLQAHGAGNAVSARIRRIQAMEARGARVLPLAADVADRSPLAAALAHIRDTLGPIHGVLHAAGVPAGGLLLLKTPEAVTATLAPKVAGTLALIELLAEMPPDFLLLFSSISATIGDIGQIDHCAANAFLDALAHAEAARGREWIRAVSWDTWCEIGQAVTTALPDALSHFRQRILAHGIHNNEGIEVFRRILDQRVPQVIVSTRDLPALLAAHVATAHALLGELAGSASAPARQYTDATYAPPENAVERRLAEIWQTMLGIDRVGIHDSFFELGGNSLIGLKIIGEIRKHFQVELSVVSLFEGPTVHALARLVEGVSSSAEPSGVPADDFQSRRDRGVRRRERQARQRRSKQQEP